MNFHYFIHECHIANSGQLEALRDELVASGLAGTGITNNYHLGYNHIWREFNRKCIDCGLNNLVASPVNAGYRPQFGVLETGDFVAGITNGYLQPNGADYYLQPNGTDYYLQP